MRKLIILLSPEMFPFLMALNTTRIFYVDDDTDDRDLFERAVQTLDHAVLLFSMAEQMLSRMQDPPSGPSIVFMDLNMPKMNGYELLAAMRSNPNFNDIPIIILSTANDRLIIQKCWDRGADLYVKKFSNFKEFARTIKAITQIDWKNRKRVRENFVFNL